MSTSSYIEGFYSKISTEGHLQAKKPGCLETDERRFYCVEAKNRMQLI